MLCLFHLVSLLVFGTALADPCRQNWVQFQNSCYGFGEITVPWGEAEEFCRATGSKLVEIESAAENDFVKAQLRQLGGKYYWAGASDIFNEGTWTWMSSGNMMSSFTDWAAGQPNDPDGYEDCLQLRMSGDYQWQDVTCTNVANFICEAEADSSVVG